MKMMCQIALLIHYTRRLFKEKEILKRYFNPLGFLFFLFFFFLNDKNEIDTLMWQMKDGEASLQCASILFCCEEVPAVNFML